MNGNKVVMTQTHSFQSGAFSFISCTSGRESLPLDENDFTQAIEIKTETKKKKFHPLRNLRKIFRRKPRRSSVSAESYQTVAPNNSEIPSTNLEQRSCSTSKLQEENSSQNFIKNNRLNPGLSLSHDSIFTPDRADSGLSSSDLGNSSLSITVLTTTPSTEFTMKSQSSCSESSLLSIGSSETEFSPVKNKKMSDLDLGVTAYKLSHNAAKHKMAVKPKRNHGAPRSRRRAVISKSPLPTTIEVNEDVSGSGLNVSSTHIYSSDVFNDLSIHSVTIKNEKYPPEVSLEEEESKAKEDEGLNQKTESFFGRFLSRRSEKKKKNNSNNNNNEPNVEDGETADKSITIVKKLSKRGKSPNHRQRIEPMEIPSSPSPSKSCDQDFVDKRVPHTSSLSPKSQFWPNMISDSPLNSPESENNYNCLTNDNKISSDFDETFSPDNKFNNVINSSFIKELTNSVNLHAKDDHDKWKILEETKGNEEEGVNYSKAKRQGSENEVLISGISREQREEEIEEKSNSPEFAIGISNCEALTIPVNFNDSIKSTESSEITSTIHEGYENVQIVELVKQEELFKADIDVLDVKENTENVSAKNSPEETDEKEKNVNTTVKLEEKIIEENTGNVLPPQRKETTEEAIKIEPGPEVTKRIKPAVSEKPKDLIRLGKSGFVKGSSTVNIESKPQIDDSNIKCDVTDSNSRVKLVERRKSELMSLTESIDNTGTKPFKKESNFKETTGHVPVSSDESKEHYQKKTESVPSAEETAVLRKKSITDKSGEQPELMKVFARRSLKVREYEKAVDDVQKSRDSDKENEILELSKEDSKKCSDEREKTEEERQDEQISKGNNKNTSSTDKIGCEVKVNITSLKPEVQSRKNVIQKYGRSLSENNVKKLGLDKSLDELNENKMNKQRTNKMDVIVGMNRVITGEESNKKENVDKNDEECCTGFKRIQQRKAEWERRAQQSAN